jgi:RNA polymerase sigma-B factor
MALLNNIVLPSVDIDGAPSAEALLEAAVASADEGRAARLRQQVVVLNLGLADGLARRYQGRGIEAEDLVQVARVALVKASLGYRPGLGHGFHPYARVTITGELKRYFRDHGWSVRPPRRLQELRVDVRLHQELLRHELQRPPTVCELANAMDLESTEVGEALTCSAGYRAESLSAITACDIPVADRLASPKDQYEELETSVALGSIIAQLDDRSRQILRMRFIEEMTQADIGRELGLGQMQVSRLLSAILGQLRTGLLGERQSA